MSTNVYKCLLMSTLFPNILEWDEKCHKIGSLKVRDVVVVVAVKSVILNDINKLYLILLSSSFSLFVWHFWHFFLYLFVRQCWPDCKMRRHWMHFLPFLPSAKVGSTFHLEKAFCKNCLERESSIFYCVVVLSSNFIAKTNRFISSKTN